MPIRPIRNPTAGPSPRQPSRITAARPLPRCPGTELPYRTPRPGKAHYKKGAAVAPPQEEQHPQETRIRGHELVPPYWSVDGS